MEEKTQVEISHLKKKKRKSSFSCTKELLENEWGFQGFQCAEWGQWILVLIAYYWSALGCDLLKVSGNKGNDNKANETCLRRPMATCCLQIKKEMKGAFKSSSVMIPTICLYRILEHWKNKSHYKRFMSCFVSRWLDLDTDSSCIVRLTFYWGSCHRGEVSCPL